MKQYRIYYLKNKNEEIVYVGKTTYELEERLKGHIRKFPHRKEYTIHLIIDVDDKNYASYLETYYINFYETYEYGENENFGDGRKGMGANNTSFKKGNAFGTKPKYLIKCVETDDVGSAKELSEKLHCDKYNIYKACEGKRKTCGGYHFIYC